jgi:hypothetical protein
MTIADRAAGLLRLLEPERAHRIAIKAARALPSRPPASAGEPWPPLSELGRYNQTPDRRAEG